MDEMRLRGEAVRKLGKPGFGTKQGGDSRAVATG